MTEQKKAKRRLTDINFAKEGSHVALVHSSQGGSANQWHEAVVMKATDDVNDEFLEKATMVKVVLPFDDFLETFFGMWEEDADTLTEILGFSDEEGEPEEDSGMSWEEWKACQEQERQNFINSVEIMKSCKDGEISLGDLNAKTFLNVLQTQQRFEEKQKEAEKAFTSSKENNVKIDEALAEVQKAKDALAEVQKAHDALAEVNKSLVAKIEAFEADAKAKKAEARKAALADVIPADKLEDVFKGVADLPDAAWEGVLAGYKALDAQVEKSFTPKGVDGEGKSPEKEDKVEAILKAQFGIK